MRVVVKNKKEISYPSYSAFKGFFFLKNPPEKLQSVTEIKEHSVVSERVFFS